MNCWISFRNRRTKHLSPKEPTLCTLNNLLVDTHGRMIHNDGTRLIVDLCVDTGVTDEVDNPFLAGVFIETEAGGEISNNRIELVFVVFEIDKVSKIANVENVPNVDPGMDLAIRLADQESC